MAHFIVIRDADDGRRARFVAAARARLDFLGGLTVDARAWRDVSVMWAASPRAPVSVAEDARGLTVLFGEAIPGPGPRRESATEYADAWRSAREAGADVPAARDGIYAAVAAEERGAVLATDILGIFPVYFLDDDEVFLAGSSPALFRLHPRCSARVDPQGLAGLLLTTHVIGGRTLWAGVRRLGAGDALIAGLGAPPRPRRQYRVPVTERHFDVTLRGCARVLGGVLDAAVRRHAPMPGPYGMLLSGGRDGRTLAGLLGETGAEVTALTYGRPGEVEMRCAQAVARVLGFRHVAQESPPERLVHAVQLTAEWELGSAGIGTGVQWQSRMALDALPPRLISGLFGDQVIGGHSPAWARVKSVEDLGFDTVFGRMLRLGFPIETARALMLPDIGEGAVDAAVADARAHFDGLEGRPSQRASLFTLTTRFRFNNGGTVWRQSFSSWPILPFVDRAVVETAIAMPASGIGDRAAQDEFVATRFPALAALPLDRNGFNDAPLRPTLAWRLRERASAAARSARARLPGGGRRLTDLYYFRLFDLNGPAWRLVRRAAEPGRDAASAFLRRDALDALLPPPDVPIRLEDPIRHAWSRMALLGLLLSLRSVD
jgi:asparagine synthase (glutamine-hydrolysing)